MLLLEHFYQSKLDAYDELSDLDIISDDTSLWWLSLEPMMLPYIMLSAQPSQERRLHGITLICPYPYV